MKAILREIDEIGMADEFSRPHFPYDRNADPFLQFLQCIYNIRSFAEFNRKDYVFRESAVRQYKENADGRPWLIHSSTGDEGPNMPGYCSRGRRAFIYLQTVCIFLGCLIILTAFLSWLGNR